MVYKGNQCRGNSAFTTNMGFDSEKTWNECVTHSSDGVGCKNISVIGDPYCWVHLLWERHLRIKPSRIQGAGKGYFALVKSCSADAIIFRKDEDILNYDVEIVTKQTLDERYAKHTAPYAVEIIKPRNAYEDGAIENSAMACVTNCPPEATRANC